FCSEGRNLVCQRSLGVRGGNVGDGVRRRSAAIVGQCSDACSRGRKRHAVDHKLLNQDLHFLIFGIGACYGHRNILSVLEEGPSCPGPIRYASLSTMNSMRISASPADCAAERVYVTTVS